MYVTWSAALIELKLILICNIIFFFGVGDYDNNMTNFNTVVM